ncbi:protein-s isoprenylcysteine o-methyltransferase [Sarcoptes scabiei]|nr:protein-s isoprenylcysteine o-methyltransferase [Sarcoptes scabiei]
MRSFVPSENNHQNECKSNYEKVNLRFDSDTSIRESNLSIKFRWIFRRMKRFFIFKSLSNKFMLIFIPLTLLLLFSVHLYVQIQSSKFINESSKEIRSRNIESESEASNLSRITFSHPFRSYNFAQQIDEVRLSLEKQKKTYQWIRNKFDEAQLKIKHSFDDWYIDRPFLLKFYCNRSSYDICRKCVKRSANIVMEQIYDDLSFENLDGGVWKQGWPFSIQEKDFDITKPKLKIFLVPHSHNDPGWIKTFDIYFQRQTKRILTNAIEFMTKHPKMKFIWAEISYLSMWWKSTDALHRDMLKKLIQNGQFEIVTGGWVMNDEANTHYWSILFQMIEGHEWLEENFAFHPRHGWAIDPFGSSPTMAYLLNEMNFRGMVIQRVHYSVKKHFARNLNLEFRWLQHWSRIDSSNQDIVCHIEPFYSYDIPHTCGPDPKICCQFDFKRLPPGKPKCPWKVNPQVINANNIEERVKILLDQYRKKSKLFRSRSLLVPLGDDFRFEEIKEWKNQYENYKKIIDHINSHPELNAQIQFATLKDYFDSLLSEIDLNDLPTLSGDFFTYADRDDHYWSGFYTSRPFFKRFERTISSHLRATDILFSIATILNCQANILNHTNELNENLTNEYKFARESMALFQHHDGITGTSKDFVMIDYAKRMFKSFRIMEKIMTISLKHLLRRSMPKLKFMHFNVDKQQPTHLFRFKPGFKNLGWALESQNFCFELNLETENDMKNYCLIRSQSDSIHDEVESIQINFLWSIISNQFISDKREICFRPKIKALSLTQFCFGECQCPKHADKKIHSSFATLYNSVQENNIVTKQNHDGRLLFLKNSIPNITIENELISLTFDSSNNGLLKSWSYLDTETKTWKTFDVSVKLMMFGTSLERRSQKSGAYIFIPDNDEPKILENISKPQIKVIVGTIESRYEWNVAKPFPIHLVFSLSRGRPIVEFRAQFHLKPVIESNYELLVRFEIPNIDNGDRFYTDLNGFQVQSRKRFNKIPLQGNIYPMNTAAWIEDKNYRFSVISAQPLGVSSLRSGTLDVFLDRRLLQDDSRGLNQVVTDNRFTIESFRLILEPLNSEIHQTDPSVPFFPLQTMIEIQTLVYPIIGLVAEQEFHSEPLFETSHSTLTFLKRSLPVDLWLVNLRVSLTKTRHLAIWLHRMRLHCFSDCRLEGQNGFNFSKYLCSDIISKLDEKILKSQLSLSSDVGFKKEIFSLNQVINLQPMRIIAFKLFKSKECESPNVTIF